MTPRSTATPEPITCPQCGSREFVRVVGGIELVVPFKFDEAARQILLRFDRETTDEPNDGDDYYRRYQCARCETELPEEIMERISDEEFEEVSEA